jgi:salicylate hydroxylase
VPQRAWREFAAFAGPELDSLTAWENKIALVGDASHALSGAFGSGAGFAMEDGWVLAQALRTFRNDLQQALPLFNKIRLPYYSRMYAYLDSEVKRKATSISRIAEPSYDDKVRNKVIQAGGADMAWIYGNHIGRVWSLAIGEAPALQVVT